jgi:hypothetical protein
MSFKSEECAWSQTSLKILGRTVVGIIGWEFDIDIEKEHLYAAGSKPIDIQDGNEKPTGSVKVLKFELDLLNDAAQAVGYAHIGLVPKDATVITCTFKKTPASQMRVITALGVAFTKINMGMEQNAKSMPVTLPFLAMDIAVA